MSEACVYLIAYLVLSALSALFFYLGVSIIIECWFRD